MNLNENLKTRRKQLAILAAVIVGGAAATGGVIWYGQHQQEQKQPAPVATPNMTGVVIVSTLTDEQNVQQLREQMLADQVRNEEAGRNRQPESLLAEIPQEEVIRLKAEEINPRKPEPLNPDADVIARVRGEENTDGQEMKAAAGVRSELEGADKASGEQSRASRVIADLANAERDMLRVAENTERGRMPEREEQTLTRTIQKER